MNLQKEMTLKRVVEIAGMSEHCDFTEQVHTKSDDGVIRPDMIVRMPDNRDLVVDAKTPIDNYLNATECNDKDKESIFLKNTQRMFEIILSFSHEKPIGISSLKAQNL